MQAETVGIEDVTSTLSLASLASGCSVISAFCNPVSFACLFSHELLKNCRNWKENGSRQFVHPSTASGFNDDFSCGLTLILKDLANQRVAA